MFARWSPLGDLVGSDGFLESAFEPPVDLYEFKEGVMIYVELPGLQPEDINIGIHGSTLTISGQRRQVRPRDHQGRHRVERSYGAFSRSFKLPKSFQTELIEADLRDGVLTLKLPRVAEPSPRAEEEAVHDDVGPTSREVRTTGETIEVEP
jgi:HSP20 family protein